MVLTILNIGIIMVNYGTETSVRFQCLPSG